jgi:hypothetical protein
MADNALLTIDLGNSETRAIVSFGKSSTGKPKTVEISFSNSFAELPNEFVIPPIYNEGNSEIIVVDDKDYATGELATREFLPYLIRPTAVENKYDSLTSKLSVHKALLEAYRAIANEGGISPSNVRVNWDVAVLLSPTDITIGEEPIKDLISHITTLVTKMPTMTKKINIENVFVFAESYAAYIGEVYDENHELRDASKSFPGESTFVVDIGAGTSDFCLVVDKKLVTEDIDNVRIGGNNIYQKVRYLLKKQLGITLSDGDVREAVNKGEIYDGANLVDLRPMISEATEDVARTLISAIRDFFEYSQYPVRSINYLLVAGGGALGNADRGIRPIAKAIIEYFQQLSPKIELLTYPVDKKAGTGSITEEKTLISPRRLNILGAYLLGYEAQQNVKPKSEVEPE